MNDEQPIAPQLSETVKRVNGFANGDRVAVVNGPYQGAYGKVEHSATGCNPDWCGKSDGGNCKIVFIDLTHIPKGLIVCPPWSRGRAFRVNEVTHVD